MEFNNLLRWYNVGPLQEHETLIVYGLLRRVERVKMHPCGYRPNGLKMGQRPTHAPLAPHWLFFMFNSHKARSRKITPFSRKFGFW
jgi:hypothetical protein